MSAIRIITHTPRCPYQSGDKPKEKLTEYIFYKSNYKYLSLNIVCLLCQDPVLQAVTPATTARCAFLSDRYATVGRTAPTRATSTRWSADCSTGARRWPTRLCVMPSRRSNSSSLISASACLAPMRATWIYHRAWCKVIRAKF